MAQLKLSVEIVEFDLIHASIKLTVMDKRNLNGSDEGQSATGFRASATNLKMTLPELHVFLRALIEFKGPLEVTTPDLELDGDGDVLVDSDGEPTFLGDTVLNDRSEAAE